MTAGKWVVLILAIVLIFADRNPTMAASKRLALVIGNSDYQHTSSLPNPVNDAQLITSVLRAQGFEVFSHVNIDLKKMKRAIADMASAIRMHGRNSVAVFYYAGHGVQVGQTNYLIPVDASIESEGDVAIEGLNVASVLESLNDAGAGVNVIVLDACRNNPYRTSFRSPTRGLARIDGPPGFLIAFSTDPGKTATDGPVGGNSPYSHALAASFGRPGIKIEEAFKQVRKEVFETTRGSQVPWGTSSLLHDLYMAGGESEGSTVLPSAGLSRPGDAASKSIDADAAKAKAEAEAEVARAREEISKAEAVKRKAKTDMERARADAERAAAEVAKAQAEADLAKSEAETARKLALAESLRQQAELQRQQAEAQRRSIPIVDTLSLFNSAAVPSFNCGEYGLKPIGHVDRNPQTDVYCIDIEAARTDYYLGQVFRQRTSGLSPSVKRDVIALQKEWILLRNQRCPGTYSDVADSARRHQIAQCLIRETQVRIQELQR
jgi:uncharacterized caspase-like protein/uncharacterized protein YecT (DUF1311 family)